MVAAIVQSMKREVDLNAFRIVGLEDGKFEKSRRIRLIHRGVLTLQNAPGFVPVAVPPLNDPAWRFTTIDDLNGIRMFSVVYTWHDHFYDTYAEGNAHLQKALRKLGSGRAYHCITCRRDNFLFFAWRIDRSKCKANVPVVLIAFEVPVGRDADAAIELVSVKCDVCIAGENHGACSHSMTALAGLIGGADPSD